MEQIANGKIDRRQARNPGNELEVSELVEGRDLQSEMHDRHSILGNIGNTPLLRIRRLFTLNKEVEIFAKAEWFNPGGSVKDRAALNMIVEAEWSGWLTKDKTIIDATSGNTGIAYAMIGSALGYKVALALPSNASRERKNALSAYGAEVILTDPLAGTDGAQQKVKEMVAANPEKYFYPDQYNNPANWKAHYRTTAPEIWEQTNHRVTHFIAGLGTTGTFVGTSRRLKEFNPSISCISFQPDSPLHGLEGLKHLKTTIVPGIYDPTVADGQLAISTEEAYEMVNRLAREEGLFVGISSGAAMSASLKVASRLKSGVVVTVFPDSGARYGSEHFSNGDSGK
ncbi:MAG TPA: cysteine synthase family protein [Candidatus Acidoferrales bacterium]|nr:cysteine synthase family protein [Candidatus Acidoferrales bacterium]